MAAAAGAPSDAGFSGSLSAAAPAPLAGLAEGGRFGSESSDSEGPLPEIDSGASSSSSGGSGSGGGEEEVGSQ